MDFKDYYKILAVGNDVGEDEIKSAYRKLAKKWHPDKNPDNKTAEDKFKEISEAYDVLSDPIKRKKFDDFIKVGKSRATYTYKNTADYSDKAYETEFSDFFKQFFKRRKSGKRTYFKGDDLRGKITVDFREAYEGSSRIVNTSVGKIRIKIKPGIENNKILKIEGKGKKSLFGGENGDLFLRIVIRPLTGYERKGVDLIKTEHIDVYTAILGGDITVHTLRNDIKVKIPENHDFSRKLRIKNYGMPIYDSPGKYGDLYLSIKYLLPRNLSPEEKNLLSKLKSLRK